ncbi:BON domain-containing protein [Candidatus Nitronereus thalassa]|uniref:BON domain-containing protein n=1 Tax=Candidatus Nitronereus thalassa TaxID=3020898 RepID=A0ABU3KBE7_9BACT|nr:BON domain-containing protein [Candidatus Nitronereus thalassa]MDT7043728.1 BON domain-containing protein [Candidatus Nitronereus thalassa]
MTHEFKAMKKPRTQIKFHPTLRILLIALAVVMCQVPVNNALAERMEQLDDNKITKAVEKAFSVDPSVPGHLIDVTTKKGVVALSGKAPHLRGKMRATSVAETIRGVQAVVNTVTIKNLGLSDEHIRQNVEEVLSHDPATEKYDLEVQVQNKTATLSGSVNSWAAGNLAEKIASGARGVHEVVNNIEVSYEGKRSDGQIADEIQKRLQTDVWINADGLDVSVRDGRVWLSGVVGSASEKRRARNNAYVMGVKSVDDSQLFVKWWAKGNMRRTKTFDMLSDDTIKEHVQLALAYDPRVFWFSIDIAVEDGVVTLQGTVDNLNAKHSAQETARHTRGVLWVNNYLKVRLPEYPDDEEIKRRIETLIAIDPDLEPFTIDPLVHDGKVTLRGTVGSYYERRLAEHLAARVKGVLEVKNNLVIPDSWEWTPDAVIQQDIEDELWWSPFVDSDDITVTVEHGIATLRGTVNSWFEYEAALENAKEGGARLVESQLTVRKYLDFDWPPPKPNP